MYSGSWSCMHGNVTQPPDLVPIQSTKRGQPHPTLKQNVISLPLQPTVVLPLKRSGVGTASVNHYTLVAGNILLFQKFV